MYYLKSIKSKPTGIRANSSSTLNLLLVQILSTRGHRCWQMLCPHRFSYQRLIWPGIMSNLMVQIVTRTPRPPTYSLCGNRLLPCVTGMLAVSTVSWGREYPEEEEKREEKEIDRQRETARTYKDENNANYNTNDQQTAWITLLQRIKQNNKYIC